MRKVIFGILGLMVGAAFSSFGEETKSKFYDDTIDARVEELLKQMTLDEKLGQLNQIGGQGVAIAAQDLSTAKRNELLYKMIENGACGARIARQ